MGFAVSWLVVSGKDSQQVLQELALRRTGKTEEFPEAPLSAARLAGGGFLVFANSVDSPLATTTALQQLSSGCTVISCQVEEHVMFSSVACHVDGRCVWRVAHDAQQGIYHLDTSGELPAEFHSIYAQSKQEQDEEGGEGTGADHMHDVPVRLAQKLTAFRHDEDVESDSVEPFEILASASGRPWWKLW